MVAFWLAIVLLVWVGCATDMGSVSAIVPAPNAMGVKVLRPTTEVRACRHSVLWWRIGEQGPLLAGALASILALDVEGNVITDASIHQQRILTGLYNRECVEVRGGLGRTIPMVMIPVHDVGPGEGPR